MPPVISRFSYPEGNWQLEEMDLPELAVQASALEFPLNINSQDANGNLLKMRVQQASSG